jgi:hypothetical protein
MHHYSAIVSVLRTATVQTVLRNRCYHIGFYSICALRRMGILSAETASASILSLKQKHPFPGDLK